MTEPTDKATTASPPKRDKFASMAAAAAAPKRDKLASMAAAAASPPKRGGDKLANMAAAASAASTPQQHESQQKEKEKQQELVKQRMKQRDQVLEDLRKAEGWTFQLVSLASQTARALENVDSLETQNVSLISKEYRETLQQIHSILSPHASLVVPYQNHGVDDKTIRDEAKNEETKTDKNKNSINMYASRVEMRLAQERCNVLQELLRLEQEEAKDDSADPATSSAKATAGDKRKRQE